MVSRKKQKHKLSVRRAARPRLRSLDALRGLAILLMIVDHVAFMFFDANIEPTNIRFLTRLSMPLFCVLMGYFLNASSEVNWSRFYQLCLAALAINLVYFTYYRQVEILASLLVCYGLFVVVRRHLVWFFPLALLYPLDPSVTLFNFPLSIVVSCVAQGMILRQHGWRVATASGTMLLAAVLLVPAPSLYLLFFILPATWLVAWGIQHPARGLRVVDTLGRYPLTAYLSQYAVLFALQPAVS